MECQRVIDELPTRLSVTDETAGCTGEPIKGCATRYQIRSRVSARQRRRHSRFDLRLRTRHGAGTYAAHARVAPKPQTARRMAAAKPMSALPTNIIAASSLSQGDDSRTDGIAMVAVTVGSGVRDSVDPIVGVAAASPTIINDRKRLHIRSSLVPVRLAPLARHLIQPVQASCHATRMRNVDKTRSVARRVSIQTAEVGRPLPKFSPSASSYFG